MEMFQDRLHLWLIVIMVCQLLSALSVAG